MVRKPEIVVQTPVQNLLSVESHVRAKLALKLRVHVVAEALIEVLSDRTARVPFDSVKNVKHFYCVLIIYASILA